MKVGAIVICISLYFCHVSAKFSLGDIKDKIDEAAKVANELLEEKGEIPRDNGCTVKWSTQGIRRGVEWKWICTCVDKCTGIAEVRTKYSRETAMEECVTALFEKLALKGEL